MKHHVLKDYIQDTSKKAGVDAVTKFGARVDRVHKDGSKWTVHWTTLNDSDQDPVEKQESAIFDSVIVASGHYHTPLVPDIRGLAEAKTQWPAKIFHSKSFRRSEGFEGKVRMSFLYYPHLADSITECTSNWRRCIFSRHSQGDQYHCKQSLSKHPKRRFRSPRNCTATECHKNWRDWGVQNLCINCLKRTLAFDCASQIWRVVGWH